MARKSGWQEFAENFQSTYGIVNKVKQGYDTKQVMNDEKFTGKDGAGAGLKGSALEKARYKALGDIATKYGDTAGGLANRTALADLNAKDRENTINQSIMKELAYIRGQGAVRNLDANSYSAEGSGINSRSSATDRTATLNARLLRMQADTDGVMSQNEERNALLDGRVAQQAATLAATNAGINKTGAETDQLTQLLPGKVAAQLGDLNLKAAQTNRIEELLSGEKALQGQQLATAITNMGLTEANTKRVLDLLPGQINAQADASALSGANVASVNANTAGQVLSNEADQAAAAIRDTETGFLTQINDPTFRADNNIETEEDAQAALISLYKSSNIPIERQMAVETALTKHGIGKLQNVAVETAQAAKNELQKGGLAGVIKWYDGVDDGDATSLNTRVVDGVYELFSSSETGENRTETVLHSGASEAELEAKLMGQITNPGSGLEIAASILEMRSKEAGIGQTVASTAKIEKATEYQTIINDTAKYSEVLKQGNTAANTKVANAQVAKLKQEVDANKGLTWNDKQAQKSFDAFITGSAYADLALEMEDNPGALELHTNRVKFGLGLIKPKPESFQGSQDQWIAMDDAGRAEF